MSTSDEVDHSAPNRVNLNVHKADDFQGWTLVHFDVRFLYFSSSKMGISGSVLVDNIEQLPFLVVLEDEVYPVVYFVDVAFAVDSFQASLAQR